MFPTEQLQRQQFQELIGSVVHAKELRALRFLPQLASAASVSSLTTSAEPW